MTSDRLVRPDYGGRCFDALPGLVERLLTGRDPHEKVVLVWIDAFGWRFVERHADHPFLRRIADDGTLERWTSQFPSTTTPHVVTAHSGLPVGQHGLYEWFIYEPALDRMVCPLMFSFAGDPEPGTLAAAGPAVAAMIPPVETIYHRLGSHGVESHCFQSDAYTPSPAGDVAFAGATVHPFANSAGGLAELAGVLQRPGPAYCFVYLDQVDSTGHEVGPDADALDAVIVGLLDELERWHAQVAGAAGDAILLLTADHGITATDPATTIYVNRERPELVRLLASGADGRPLAPAGSARDLFLHARPGCVDELVAELAAVVNDRAEVRRTDELVGEGLFGPSPSPRLTDRLGDVLVLPGPGGSAWWWEPGRFEQHFRGHHGGLSAAEMEIPFGRLSLA